MPATEKKWRGSPPVSCDLCGSAFKGEFIDGKTRMGPWGLLCVPCHIRNGVGLGTGRGQKYDLVSLKKVAG